MSSSSSGGRDRCSTRTSPLRFSPGFWELPSSSSFTRCWTAARNESRSRGHGVVLGRPFFRLASAFVIHLRPTENRSKSGTESARRPCVVIPHGPLDHHASNQPSDGSAPLARRTAPPDTLNLLFFGIIRPYKGLEDLVQAFEIFDDQEVKRYWLTVVGETWEGWDLPIRLIQSSRHRARITLVNRFVDDDEVIAHFADADAVVLPYHRSSASSPAHVAMSNGLPLVITAVGGLPEAVADYEGAILVPPRDPVALRDAIRRLPRSAWTALSRPPLLGSDGERYGELMEQLGYPHTRCHDPSESCLQAGDA